MSKRDVLVIYEEKFGDEDIQFFFNQDYIDPVYIRFILKYCVVKNKKYSMLTKKEKVDLDVEYFYKKDKLTLKDFMMKVEE